MDYATVNNAISSAKAAAVILQGLLKLKLDNETLVRINDALQQVAEIQQQLFSTHEQLFKIQQERDELQRQIAANDDWNNEKINYRSVNTVGGAVVYQ